MNKTYKIGTRGSKLALYQAEKVKSVLEQTHPESSFSIEIIKTKGDKILDVALSKIGDKGLFTKEIEDQLIDGKIDMAVHSLKDLPTILPKGLQLGGVLQRADIRDALVNSNGKKIKDLTTDDIIATSSLRRRAQLLAINPDFKIVDIRGNVNTRLEKMKNGHCNAMIMASAGLMRLGLQQNISEYIDPEIMIPAVAQGAIAIETRENDNEVSELISGINHNETLTSVLAEREFMNVLEGGCQVPVGCYSIIKGDNIALSGFIASLNGSTIIKEKIEGPVQQAIPLANKLAKRCIDLGASKILDQIRGSV